MLYVNYSWIKNYRKFEVKFPWETSCLEWCGEKGTKQMNKGERQTKTHS